MRTALFLCCLIVLQAFASGCQSYRPVSVAAVDAETKKPIPGATVRISYPMTASYSAPAALSAATGDDGVAQLRAAVLDDGFQVEATAPGYLVEERSLAADAVKDAHAAPVVMEMYAGPAPSVELVVPVGYRGLVRVETRIRDDLPFPPGQRCFRYDVPASGVVQVVGPALFRACRPSMPSTRIAPLSSDAKDLDVGFRWVKSENGFELYLVGTRFECDACRRAPTGDSRPSDGGPPEGRGRRNRRGSPPPSDSGAAAANP